MYKDHKNGVYRCSDCYEELDISMGFYLYCDFCRFHSIPVDAMLTNFYMNGKRLSKEL